MIKPLLEYQDKEREKLLLLAAVEGGRARVQFDESNRTIEHAKRTLLNLENDAKVLLGNYETVSKNLNEYFKEVEAYKKNAKTAADSPDETNTELGLVSTLLSKIAVSETQLNDIAARITQKTQAFEDAKIQVVKAQKNAAAASALYEAEKKDLKPKLEKLDDELKKIGSTVDPSMLEKYKSIRKNKSKGDIVVPLDGNRCGGCHFELPLSLIHTLSNHGYIICEECGKIIYKV